MAYAGVQFQGTNPKLAGDCSSPGCWGPPAPFQVRPSLADMQRYAKIGLWRGVTSVSGGSVQSRLVQYLVGTLVHKASQQTCVCECRPQQLSVPPVKCVLPMFYAAALLMASTGAPTGALLGGTCQTAIPLPSRPLNLPLSSPSLLAGDYAVCIPVPLLFARRCWNADCSLGECSVGQHCMWD